MAFVEVPVQLGRDPVGLPQLLVAVVVALEGEGGGMELEIGAATVQVVIFAEDGLQGVVVDGR